MTIQFPRLMPTVGAMAVSFEPERVDFLAPEAGGQLGAVSAGFPRWMMRVTLNAMSFANADIWRAWLAVQRGAQRPFVAFDIDRQKPRRHAGFVPYSPTTGTWSQTINADGLALLTLGGLMAGQTISTGDYVGFLWDGHKRELTRAVETRIVGGTGTVTVAVEPPIASPVPARATVTLRQAGCLMRIVSGETKLGEQGLGYFTSGSTIVAAQVFVP